MIDGEIDHYVLPDDGVWKQVLLPTGGFNITGCLGEEPIVKTGENETHRKLLIKAMLVRTTINCGG